MFFVPLLYSFLLTVLTLASPLPTALEAPTLLPRGADRVPILLGANFPDPGFIRTSTGWHAFSTNARINNNWTHVQYASTPDWKNWYFTSGQDAMPTLASWVDPSSPRVWAPDVNVLPDGTYIMYYCAALKSQTNLHCVSYATSKNVGGPYVDSSSSPFICPQSAGGAIDPAGFFDAKTNERYVVYKVDGNAIGHGGECGNTVPPIVGTPLLLQQVSTDGFTKLGSPVQLITNEESDGPYVEAPSLSYLNGKYILFYSPQCYLTSKYSVSYATSDSITGPYTRAANFLFSTGSDGMVAPGGLDIAVNGDHAMWHANYGLGRAAYTGILKLSGGVVTAT
ncbi:hypothetical protein B0A48_07768 [Cryoendolithus antarcticus]|uniref:Glycoside hydrolase family 43 protein n=1 Tax=Cryoendolithus antarcticus TaxID=1507870 RepID=A0A1V8T7J6_9PEZI|nr:hypothetical protein B0A48_07768 [Cryoendolithus antarcticus]